MAAQMYAQTRLKFSEVGEDGKKVKAKVIEEGEKVSKADLGDHFDEFKESGAIGPRSVEEQEDGIVEKEDLGGEDGK